MGKTKTRLHRKKIRRQAQIESQRASQVDKASGPQSASRNSNEAAASRMDGAARWQMMRAMRTSNSEPSTARMVSPLRVTPENDVSEREATVASQQVESGRKVDRVSRSDDDSSAQRRHDTAELRRQSELGLSAEAQRRNDDDVAANRECVGRKSQTAEHMPAEIVMDGDDRARSDRNRDEGVAASRLRDNSESQRLSRQTDGAQRDAITQPKDNPDTKSAAAILLQKGSGEPLAPTVRRQMEAAFSANFSSVRIHTDRVAHQAAEALHARAFTRGRDIYFSRNSSPADTKLLAHELTHVVQQGHAPDLAKVQRKHDPSMRRVDRDAASESEDVASDLPTEEEKAAALALAAKAASAAEQTSVLGKSEITKSIDENRKEEAEQEKSQQQVKKDQAATKGKSGSKPKRKVRRGGQRPSSDQEGRAAAAEATTDIAPRTPESDPAFQGVVGILERVAKKQRKHPSASSKTDEAQEAAESPAQEIEGKAQTAKVGKMQEAETPAFDGAAFKAQLMKRIVEMTPKTVEDVDDFKKENKLGNVKGEMQGQVAEEKSKSDRPLADATDSKPDTGSVQPKKTAPLPDAKPGSAPGSVGANEAAPKPRTTAEVEGPIEQNTDRIEKELQTESITERQLEKSNEPSFQTALQSKKQAEVHAREGSTTLRQSEQEQIGVAQTEATTKASDRTAEMFDDRTKLLNQVHSTQTQTKGKDERAREKVGKDIQKIYESTKQKVDKILSGLDAKVEKAFDAGANKAKLVFEAYVESKMEAYKQERYGGWFGWARWGKDKLLGMPDKVNAFYTKGRSLYLNKMDAVIDGIVVIIGAELTAAKAEIAKGKKEIQVYVDGLPDSLKSVGAEAAEQVQSQFDDLASTVENKQGELIDTLATKYKENVESIDARIDELKAANQGLVDAAINAVVGVVKTIIEIKNLLLTVLGKIAHVVTDIIADPIGFLGNLIAGLKQGFQNFVANIGTHLKAGLIGWLTGSLGGIGIQIPKDLFSLKGIFTLVMQVLGITWDFVRRKAVKLMGERVVKFLETAFEPFKSLITEGIGGLWNYVKEQFANLKEMVLDQIKSMVITQVITAGMKWLLGLLNPAAAFVKAAMTIYEIVKFLWERAKQILDFINGVVDAVAAIAKGAIGGAAKLVENALSKALPLVIGFLASLLGISGLAKRVQDLIKSLRKKFSDAVDQILVRAKKFARRLFGKIKKAGASAARKLIQWWKVRKQFKGKDGKEHAIYFEGNEKNAALVVASAPQTFDAFVKSLDIDSSNKDAVSARDKAVEIAKKVDSKKKERTGAKTEEETKKNKEKKRKDLEALLTELAPHVSILLGLKNALPESSKPKYTPTKVLGASLGESMKIAVLTSTGPSGSEPSVINDVWKVLAKRREGGRSYYVRGHLLNHNIHGPGNTWENLTILSQKGNKRHLDMVENPVKVAVNAGAIVSYKVEANYNQSLPGTATDSQLTSAGIDPSNWDEIREIREYEQKAVPDNLIVQADLIEPNGRFKKSLVPSKPVPNPVETDLSKYEVGEGATRERVSLTNDSITKISENTGFGEEELEAIQIAAIMVANSGHLRNYDQIITKLVDLGAGDPGLLAIVDNGTKASLRHMDHVVLND